MRYRQDVLNQKSNENISALRDSENWTGAKVVVVEMEMMGKNSETK